MASKLETLPNSACRTLTCWVKGRGMLSNERPRDVMSLNFSVDRPSNSKAMAFEFLPLK